MRIAFVITRGDSIGGAQIHVRDLSAALKTERHKVRVFVGSSGLFTDFLTELGVEFEVVNSLGRAIHPVKDLVLVRELKERLESFEPDLISSHGSKAGYAARMAGRSLAKNRGTKVFFTAHGWAFTDGVSLPARLLYSTVERYLARRSDRIITVSRNDYDLALRFGVSSPRKMRVVRNGLPYLPPVPRKTLGPKTRIISVARFQAQKDHSTLFQALAGLKDLDWELSLVGDGPLEAEKRAEAKLLGLEDRVHFLGQRKDVGDLLEKHDLFCLITHWEGLPRSIIEAMRAGLPVVASDVGGVSELVIEGKTGTLVPRGDVDTLKERLRPLLASPRQAAEWGLAGRKLYEEAFTFDRMFEETKAVYREVLEQPI